jgi:murein DD-endopeptidase MepM/ murein hydrolase activator NlpD
VKTNDEIMSYNLRMTKWKILSTCLFLVACNKAVDDVVTESAMPVILTRSVTASSLEKLPGKIEEVSTPTMKVLEPAAMTATPVNNLAVCSPLGDHLIVSLNEIVSSPYDPPPIGKDDRHQGVDFAYYNHLGRKSIKGEAVTAVLDGHVSIVVPNRYPYGNMVILETQRSQIAEELVVRLGIEKGESLYHLYAHLDEINPLNENQRIRCGDYLGIVGNTGYNIPVPHLHFETRIGPEGIKFEGMAFYDTQANQTEMDNYRRWRMSGEFRHFNPMDLFEWIIRSNRE